MSAFKLEKKGSYTYIYIYLYIFIYICINIYIYKGLSPTSAISPADRIVCTINRKQKWWKRLRFTTQSYIYVFKYKIVIFLFYMSCVPSRRGTRHAWPWSRRLFKSRFPACARDIHLQHSEQRLFALNSWCPRWSTYSDLLPSSEDVHSSSQWMPTSLAANVTCHFKDDTKFLSVHVSAVLVASMRTVVAVSMW